MGYVVPTMPPPPRPRRTVACCEYCRRSLDRFFGDACPGCGAPVQAAADVDLIECTTPDDPQRVFVPGFLTVNECRQVQETWRRLDARR